jgi:hypothetical protein
MVMAVKQTKKPVLVAKAASSLAAVPATAPDSAAAKTVPGYAEFADLSRDNLAAVLKANATLAAGWETLTKDGIVQAREAFSAAGTAANELLRARTLDQVIRIQADLAKSGAEALLTQSAKLAELGLALADSAFAPLGLRIETTLAKLTSPSAT